MTRPKEYFCYTDGSCKASEGSPGGWGFVIKSPGLPAQEGYGKAQQTLAKVMEYQAVAEALAALPSDVSAVVLSDDRALVENLTRNLGNWSRNGFASVDPLIADSARRIAQAIADKKLLVRFQWLRSHNGNAGNERADALAAQGAREARAALPTSPRKR
jgi:ribonuclease HI